MAHVFRFNLINFLKNYNNMYSVHDDIAAHNTFFEQAFLQMYMLKTNRTRI